MVIDSSKTTNSTGNSREKLSENLSSDSLFTFTAKLEYLISMLEHGIQPRYIFERIPILEHKWYYIVAAKCFCDIPLGKIKNHLNWFGNYGLGIKKTFLKSKGVTPILYMHNESHLIINALKDGGIENLKNFQTLPLLKRYKGDDYMRSENGIYMKKFRQFYDEREWRYIPKDNDLETGNGFIINKGLEEAWKKNKSSPFNKIDSVIKLTPNEIEYIIIDNFKEFKGIKSELQRIYPEIQDYELMLSKTLIADRIIRDF
jgi:hypothetical protein